MNIQESEEEKFDREMKASGWVEEHPGLWFLNPELINLELLESLRRVREASDAQEAEQKANKPLNRLLRKLRFW